MIKVWNKTDEINGVNARDVINSMSIKDNDEIFLVVDDRTNRVTEIQFKNTICANYGIDVNSSCLEVAQRYMEIKEEEKQNAEIERVTLEQLKQQNEELKQGLLEMSEIIYS